jgi:hypothetical protein
MITGSTDKCYICGENGHFTRETTIIGDEIEDRRFI